MFDPIPILSILFFLFFLLFKSLPKNKNEHYQQETSQTNQPKQKSNSKITIDSMEQHLSFLLTNNVITLEQYNEYLRKTIPYA